MSDTCQTPGCGHAKSAHQGTSCWGPFPVINGVITACPCTRYTAPTETVTECHHTLFINTHRCTKCGVEVPWDYRPPTREQVLADAKSKFTDEWFDQNMPEVSDKLRPKVLDYLVAGYLAGRGIDNV